MKSERDAYPVLRARAMKCGLGIFVVVLGGALPLLFGASGDGIHLTVSPGPGAADVNLGWTGTIPTYTVFRSTDPATATDPGNSLGETSLNTFIDSPPIGSVFFYRVVGECPGSQINCGGYCDLDTDADTVCDGVDNCPTVANVAQSDQDGDLTGDVCDYCIKDPQKVDRGLCGCFLAENTGDADGDGVIDCHDQCPGADDNQDTDAGGLPDACDPCPTGMCDVTLPDRFYAELPLHRPQKVSRNGQWIAAIEADTFRGVLIPTEPFIANPYDTSYFESMGDERVLDIRGFSDDNNLVLATISTYVPESSREMSASALYDRTNGSWRVLGLYDPTVAWCGFYSSGGDLTSDGSVIFGRTPTVEAPCRLRAFRYDVAADTWQLFGGPEGEVRLLEAVSADGTRIVGTENRAPIFDEFGNQIGGGSETGVEWTVQAPDVFTPQWLGDAGAAWDVTADGSAISLTTGGLIHRWTLAGGLEQLGSGTLDAAWTPEPRAISDAGDVVVGSHYYLLTTGLPFIWVEGVGFGRLYDYLIYRGHTELGSFDDYFHVWDTSGNGRIIVGDYGSTFSGLPGWVVVTVHP